MPVATRSKNTVNPVAALKWLATYTKRVLCKCEADNTDKAVGNPSGRIAVRE
jgi:hypothetical protein